MVRQRVVHPSVVQSLFGRYSANGDRMHSREYEFNPRLTDMAKELIIVEGFGLIHIGRKQSRFLESCYFVSI